MAQELFVIHENADLIASFQKEVGKNGISITPLHSTDTLLKKNDLSDPVVVIDAAGDWAHELKTLQKMKKEGKEFYAIVSSASMLKKTLAQIHQTAISLNQKSGAKPAPAAKEHEPCLAELVEKKLTEFVRKIKNCDVKNLYSLLIREFEKPLITLALKETEGNQIQAAQLLGMNRNTLRKKMKELKISVVKTKRR